MHLKYVTFSTCPAEWQPPDDSFVARLPTNIDDKQQLLEALYVFLQLPDYFGSNWDALCEVLRDFHWIDERRVVIIHEELPALGERDLVIYLELLDDAMGEWRPNEDHEVVVVFPESAKDVIASLEQSGEDQ